MDLNKTGQSEEGKMAGKEITRKCKKDRKYRKGRKDGKLTSMAAAAHHQRGVFASAQVYAADRPKHVTGQSE